MDKKFSVKPNRKSSDRQDSSSTDPQTNFSSALLQNAAKNLAKQKRATPELQAYDGSNNIWQDLSTIFKSDEPTCKGSPSVKLLQGKQPSSSRRLNTIFRKCTTDRSQCSKENDDRDIAMAVRLPSGATTNSVAVTVELEAVRRSGESTTDFNEGGRFLQMECTEDTDTKTIYSGVMKVPTNADISKLAGMPLYLLDSQEKLLLKPTTKLSHRIVIRPSEDMLLGDDSQPLSEDVKIKLHFEKAKKVDEGGKPKHKQLEEQRISVNQDKNIEIPNFLPETAVCTAAKSDDFMEMENVISNASNLAAEMLQRETAKVINLLDAATSYENVKSSSTKKDDFRVCSSCVRRQDETIAQKIEEDCSSKIQTRRKKSATEKADTEEPFSSALANERITEAETVSHFPTVHIEERRKSIQKETELKNYFPALQADEGKKQTKSQVYEAANFAPKKFEEIVGSLERTDRSPSVLTSETTKSQRTKGASRIEQEGYFPAIQTDDRIKSKPSEIICETASSTLRNRLGMEERFSAVQAAEKKISTETSAKKDGRTSTTRPDNYVSTNRTPTVTETSDYAARNEEDEPSMARSEDGSFVTLQQQQKSERKKTTDTKTAPKSMTDEYVSTGRTSERRSTVTETSNYTPRKEAKPPSISDTENGSFVIQRDERRKSASSERAKKSVTDDYESAGRTGEITSTVRETSNYPPRKEDKLRSVSKTKEGSLSIQRSEKRKSTDTETGRTSTVTESAGRTGERKSTVTNTPREETKIRSLSKTEGVNQKDERRKSTDTETRSKLAIDVSARRTSDRTSTVRESSYYTPRKEDTIASIHDMEAFAIQKDEKKNSKSATRNYVPEGRVSREKRLTETDSLNHTSRKEKGLASISDTEVGTPAVQRSERTKSIKSLTASKSATKDSVPAGLTGERKSAETKSSNLIPRKEEKISSISETDASSIGAERRNSSKTETSLKSKAKDYLSAIRTGVRTSTDTSASKKDEKIACIPATKDDSLTVQGSKKRKSSKTEAAPKTGTDDYLPAGRKTERRSTGFDTSKYEPTKERKDSSLPREERRKSSKTEAVDYSSAGKKDGRRSTISRAASEPRKYTRQPKIEDRSSGFQTDGKKSSTETEVLSDNYLAAEELDDDSSEPGGKNREQPPTKAKVPAQNLLSISNQYLNASYYMPSCRVRDNSTQYSNTNFMADKSVEIQASFLFPTIENYGLFGYNAHSSGRSTPVSSHLFLTRTPSLKITRLMSESSRSNKSSETNLPMSTTSTNTEYSNTIASRPSDYSAYYDGDTTELQVPSNSPSSCTELKDSNGVAYDVHAQYDTSGLSCKKGERSRIPVSSWHSNGKYSSRLTDSFVDCMTSQSDVYFTDQREPSASNFKLPFPNIKDKTLELLESARSKLISYMNIDKATRFEKTKKFNDHDLEDLCGILPIHHNLDELCSRKKEETRSVNVYASTFSTSGNKTQNYDHAEISKRCYEDDDEYYERQRRDVRRYFQEGARNQETKKNFNFYLSGDGLAKDVCTGNSVFHVYPLIIDIPLVKSLKSQATAKLHEAEKEPSEAPSTSFNETQSQSPIQKSKNDINDQLENEINSLQNMYDDMCSSMKYILDLSNTASTSKNLPPTKIAGNIENIGTDLAKTFSDLQMCLSTIDEILADSTNSLVDAIMTPSSSDLINDSSDYQHSSKFVSDLIDDCVFQSTETQSNSAQQSDETRFSDLITDCLCKTLEVDAQDHDLSKARQKTYLTMEHDIKRTIQELLKESKDIKEAVILNGGKEEAEPPFLFDYINLLDAPNPLLKCKAILDDIVNLSLDTAGAKNQTPQDDVNYILNILLEEVAKNNNVNDRSFLESQSEDVLVDMSYETPGGISKDLQKGDSKNEQGGSKIEKTYFCTSIPTPKIPKTSFSFGETPAKYLKLQSSDFKPAVRTRDVVSIIGKRSITRNQGTSRLINEILKLDDHQKCSTLKAGNNDDLSLYEDVPNTCGITKEFLELASAAEVFKNPTLNEPNLQMQQVLTYKSYEALLRITSNNPTENEEANNNQHNSDSENDSPTPPPTNGDINNNSKSQSSTHSNTENMQKSKKCFQFIQATNSNLTKSQPSTSANLFKITRTTDEEELINTTDLTEDILSSSENEYFIPVGVSKISQKSSNVSRARERPAYDSSSSDEVVTPRKKTSKKRKRPDIIEIMSKTSLTSNSASGQFIMAQPPIFSNDQDKSSGVSYIVLKPTQGRANLPNLMTNSADSTSKGPSIHTQEKEILQRETNFSEISVGNVAEVVDSEYEGDLETIQMSLPKPKHRYKSEHELNNPEEIAKIEENVRENDQLERAAMVILLPSESSTNFDYEDSNSEYSVNTDTSA